MTPGERTELHAVVKGAMAETALGFTKELRGVEQALGDKIADVRDSVQAVPAIVTDKINEYDAKQVSRRRWVLRTLLLFAGLLLTSAGIAFTHL